MAKLTVLITAATLSLFVVIGAYQLWVGDWLGVFVAAQALGIGALPFVLHRQFSIYTPLALRSGIALFALATLILGELAQFYTKIWWWDLVLHGVAGIGLTIISFVVLVHFFKQRELRAVASLSAFLAFTLSMSFAVLWEVYEFLVDTFFNPEQAMQPNNTDTMTDLLIAIVGAAAISVIGYRYIKWRGGGFVGEIIADGRRGNQ